MKKLILVAVAFSTITLALPTVAHDYRSVAQDYRFEATDNQLSTKMCVLAASEKKVRLRSTIDSFHLSKAYVANKVKCNGINITEFALKHKAMNSHSFLARYYRQGTITVLAANPSSAIRR